MPMLERIAGNRELKQDLKTALGSGGSPTAFCWWGSRAAVPALPRAAWRRIICTPMVAPMPRRFCAGRIPNPLCAWGGASGQIKVEAIRDARQNIQKSALSSDAEGRVLFIYGAQNLNGASANAMLKIMEEPPEGVMFLLTASSAAAVLPTIRSRCAAYTMHRCRTEECAATLRTRTTRLNEQNAQDLAFV